MYHTVDANTAHRPIISLDRTKMPTPPTIYNPKSRDIPVLLCSTRIPVTYQRNNGNTMIVVAVALHPPRPRGEEGLPVFARGRLYFPLAASSLTRWCSWTALLSCLGSTLARAIPRRRHVWNKHIQYHSGWLEARKYEAALY